MRPSRTSVVFSTVVLASFFNAFFRLLPEFPGAGFDLRPLFGFVVAGTIVGLVFGTGGGAAGWLLGRSRRRDMLSWAVGEGLPFCSTDTTGLDGCRFHLFRRGLRRGWDNVASGTWRGLEVRVADYWYDEKRQGTTFSQTRMSFSVVVLPIEADLPPVRIEKHSLVSRVAEHMEPIRLPFESEAFDRAFAVHTPDREFAFKLLDARMITWLLRTEGDHGYEVNGPWVLACTSPPLRPEELSTLLFAAKGFVERIPRLVWADYGKAEA